MFASFTIIKETGVEDDGLLFHCFTYDIIYLFLYLNTGTCKIVYI